MTAKRRDSTGNGRPKLVVVKPDDEAAMCSGAEPSQAAVDAAGVGELGRDAADAASTRPPLSVIEGNPDSGSRAPLEPQSVPVALTTDCQRDHVRDVGSRLTTAVEAAWRSIETVLGPLPVPVVVVGAGSKRGQKVLLRGGWARSRWVTTDKGEAIQAELHLSGEILGEGGHEVFTELLKLAAHAICDARGIQETSRQGRYCNANFKAAGEEVGLVVLKGETFGWDQVSMREETAARFRPAIAELDEALRGLSRINENDVPKEEKKKGKKAGARKFVCLQCGEQIRMSKGDYMKCEEIKCRTCRVAFQEEVDEDDEIPGPEVSGQG